MPVDSGYFYPDRSAEIRERRRRRAARKAAKWEAMKRAALARHARTAVQP